MTDGFVPASLLYDVATGSTHRHPSLRASDIEVREAVENAIAHEVRTDAWCNRAGVGCPDPEADPLTCSICGSPLDEAKRVRGENHCDWCIREGHGRPAIDAALEWDGGSR